jgi:hypothetical protein
VKDIVTETYVILGDERAPVDRSLPRDPIKRAAIVRMRVSLGELTVEQAFSLGVVVGEGYEGGQRARQ